MYHTTLIDLYGLKNDFPGHKSTLQLLPYNRVAEMEKLLAADLNFYKFIPYIQLHEFEALLFSDAGKMEEWLSLYNNLPDGCFTQILSSVPEANPELINEGIETAPSKRILSVCGKSYDKIDDGILILKEIGIQTIRKHCKHFDEWLTILENLDQKQ